eukprot:m.878705 g.878705  ORF g.878705 m.878705 type:complete len:275 (-) comp59838_c0_seq5:62-886(-)
MWARVSGCAGLAADCARLHTSARVLLRVPIHRAVCPPPVARRGSRFLSLTPRKLEESKDQTPAAAPAKPPVTFSSWVVSVVGRLTGIESRGQVLRRSAEQLYNACPNPSQIYALCSLPDTFQSWFLVMHLHVWMCMVRLKSEGSDGAKAYKQLVALMWHDVQYRMKLAGVNDSSIVKHSLRELVDSFYGLTFAYDEGIMKDDHVLATALWRNMFHHAPDKSTASDIAALVAYVRRELHSLEQQDSEAILTEGKIVFGPPPILPMRPQTALKVAL